MKRKIICILVAIMLITINGYGVYANTENDLELQNLESVTKKGIMNIENISSLNEITYEQTYSVEEMLLDKYITGLISKEEYENQIKLKNNKFNNNISMYATSTEIRTMKFTMDTHVIKKPYNREYRLTPIFYVELEFGKKGSSTASGTPIRIVSISNPHIYTGDGENCIFGGTIYYKLEAGNRFFYGVYGDVYKTGDISISGGISVGIGKSTTAYLNFNYKNNYIANVSFSDTYYSYAMLP